MNPTHTLQDHDLVLAAELQAALLPPSCPSDGRQQVVAARNRMCGMVGGDFYDFIQINPEQVAIIIGDVVGHGVRASLLMAQIMGFLRGQLDRASRPSEMIVALNGMLVELGSRVGQVMLCSLFYSVVDLPTGISVFVNAGHPRPLLCDHLGRDVMPLGGQNILLGIQEFVPVEGCHTFTAGQRLVLFTDGLIDAQNPEGDALGDRRFEDLVRQTCAVAADEAAESIFSHVASFHRGSPQTDDETLVIVDRL